MPANDGLYPYFAPRHRYIIREKGVLEVGFGSCANCHTRIMPDGSFVPGAQGMVDVPATEASQKTLRDSTADEIHRRVENAWAMFGAPWIMDHNAFDEFMTKDELLREDAARHPGILARQGTSAVHPPHVPSLIGIGDLRYLDATGLVRHRSIGDLMRYAIANQGLDTLATY